MGLWRTIRRALGPAEPDVTAEAERGGEIERARELATSRELPYAEAEELLRLLDPRVGERVSGRAREKRRVLPVALRDGTLIAATDSATSVDRALLRAAGAREAQLHVVTPSGYRRLERALELGQIPSDEPEGVAADDLLDHDVGEQPESVALFESILIEAAESRASDLHLEQTGARAEIRLRVDGDLRPLAGYEISTSRAHDLVRLAKVRAAVDVTDARVPNSGSFASRIAGRRFFVRVQTQPTLHGENLVLRLLPQDPELQAIDRLGFPQGVARSFRRLLRNPGGLLLVVGPTGSGKTTTLYAGLRALARDRSRKVISIEDPVEYACPGIQQVQVAEDVGFGFADAMRVFVRQDPDVILLGEVRDRETAREAIRASQTGHLVLTTLHCNDAVDAIQRLLDLDMHPNAVASELLAVFAQRLAKRICDGCREETAPDAEVSAEVFPDGPPDGFRTFTGRGCQRCDSRGTTGRTAVVELLPATRALRGAITTRAALDDLRSVARAHGLASLRERALELVGEGVVDFRELPRFVPLERLRPEPD